MLSVGGGVLRAAVLRPGVLRAERERENWSRDGRLG